MKVCGTTKITYQGKEIDLGGEWKRITMIDAIKVQHIHQRIN